MGDGTRRIRILVGPVSLDAELKTNQTAEAIYKACPIQAVLNTWGEEFYFKVPGVKDHREMATTRLLASSWSRRPRP